MKKNGVIIINKEEGMTSQTVVNRVKRLLGLQKAGHTGTLDPMATGVLPVLCDRGVKCSEYLLSSTKHYTATMRLGVMTDTEDITGNVLSTSDAIPSEEAVLAAVPHFIGEISQIPPMYSALKKNGRKLVDLARQGITVEREPRRITVYRLSAKKVDRENYRLDVVCSKGTYIRTLCADIGEFLGCHAAMASLCRAESGGFSLNDAITLGELEAMTEEERCRRIIPVETLFRDKPALKLSAFYSRLAKNGCEIYLRKIGVDVPVGTRFRLYDSDGVFFGIGDAESFPDGDAVRVLKHF